MLMFRAIVAFLLLPGIFAGFVPWDLSYLDPWKGNGWSFGWFFLALGLLMLLLCTRDFLVLGKGTLAPWSPPQYIVTDGLYRYTRNPMYLGVLSVVLGWALVNGSPLTFIYLLFAACAFHLRVTFYEEIWLAEQFPSQWYRYSKNVPRWLGK